MTAPANFEEAQKVFAAALPGYTLRPHQIALAQMIERALAGEKHGLFQAGTGTGKSFALLIPMILSGLRTIVATFNKALQNQYIKDLQFLQEHLGVDFTWAILKGRANYPCLAKVRDLRGAPLGPAQREIVDQVTAISTPDAIRDLAVVDREDFPRVTDEDWRGVSMSTAECPGKKHCPFGEECITERAKARAAAADIVVTNTAYLMQDLQLRLKSGGSVSLLGEADQVVIDEAHTLPDVATGALEDTLGLRGLQRLAADAGDYLSGAREDMKPATALDFAAQALWMKLEFAYAEFAGRAARKDLVLQRAIEESRGGLVKAGPMPVSADEIMDEKGYGVLFADLCGAVEDVHGAVKIVRETEDSGKIIRSRLLTRLNNMTDRLMAYATDDNTVRWADTETFTFRGEKEERLFLRSAPLSVAPFLRKALWDSFTSVIMSSATLAFGSNFDYLAETIGLTPGEAMTYDAGSPFDYPRQATLFVPDGQAPSPAGTTKGAWGSYAQEVTGYLVGESGGGALLLYTSRAAMDAAHQVLAERFRARGLTVLKQNEQPAPELIRIMREDGNAVLFALRTFFEGVDIQGSALRLVVLDKLPFSVPTDLLHQARCAAIEKRYRNTWASWDRIVIPSMHLVLTQAFGRLIRHADDRGVVAILDNRLRTKSYGTTILGALPPARQETDVAEVGKLLASIR